MSAALWRSRDAKTAAATLNANAATFATCSFKGWHAEGEAFSPPEPSGTGRVAFGVVGVGRVFPVPGMRQGVARPPRSADLRVELYISERVVQSVWEEIYPAALAALYSNAPAGFAVSAQSWDGPNPGDEEVPKFASYRSVVATVPYIAVSTV